MFLCLSFEVSQLRRLRKGDEIYVSVDKTSQGGLIEVGGVHRRKTCRHFVVRDHVQTGRYAEPSLPSVPFRMLVFTESNECRVNLSSGSKILANLVRGGKFKISPLSRSQDQISIIGGLSLQYSQATELRVPSKLIRDGDLRERQPSCFVLPSWGSLGFLPLTLPGIF